MGDIDKRKQKVNLMNKKSKRGPVMDARKKVPLATLLKTEIKWLLHRVFLRFNHAFFQLDHRVRMVSLLAFFLSALVYLTHLLSQALHLTF